MNFGFLDCCDSKKIKCAKIFFSICSLGLGNLMWEIHNMDFHCCRRNNNNGSNML